MIPIIISDVLVAELNVRAFVGGHIEVGGSGKADGHFAGEIAGPPDAAPGAVEPAPPTAHRPRACRQNPESASVTAIDRD